MSTTPDLVDWSLAVRVASSVAGRGPDTSPGVRAEVRKDFREFTRRSDDLVRDFTGLVPPTPAPNPIVLDRGGWLRATKTSCDVSGTSGCRESDRYRAGLARTLSPSCGGERAARLPSPSSV